MPVGKKQKTSHSTGMHALVDDAKERRRKTSLRSYYKRQAERSQEEQDRFKAQRREREAKPENRLKKRERMARLRLEQDHGIIESH